MPREVELIYFTETPFAELVGGATSNYFDHHLANLASLTGRIRVLHFSPQAACAIKLHPRVAGVEHVVGGQQRTSVSALLSWAFRARRYVSAPALIYIPFPSAPSLVAAVWRRSSPVRIYSRYTWSPIRCIPFEQQRLKRALLNRLCEQALLRSSDWIGAGSATLVAEARRTRRRGDHVALTSNLIEVGDSPAKESYDFGGRPRLVTVGRLVGSKRVAWTIEAARAIDAELHIFGDGPDRAALEAQSRGARVVFHGAIANREVIRRLASMDIFVTASAVEGVPKALLEAMSAALPCVGCRVLGVAEWLDAGRGIVAENSPAAFTATIRNVCEDAAARRTAGKLARQYVVEHHSPEKILAADRSHVARALEETAMVR